MFRFCFLFGLVLAVLPAAKATADVSGRAHVIDADTIDVIAKDGRETRIRIHGIDAPEPDQTCTTELGPIWACGKWASSELRNWIEGQQVTCDQTDYDTKYNRLVAICHLGAQDIGQELVRDGVAFAYRKYSMDYDFDEKTAALHDVGLHAARVQSPEQFRKTRTVGRFPLDPNCRIKGNISGRGAFIFHVPGQRYYEQTGIRPEKGERWFCSRTEAIRAGWRASKI